MTSGSVAEIYEQHVRHLPAEQQLELLALIARRLAYEAALSEKRPRRSIRELHGAGRHAWDGTDAQEYVNRLRSESDIYPE